MNVGMILKFLPWNLIGEVVIAVLEMVVESTDNEYDDKLIDTVNDMLNRAEEDHPDSY